MKMSMDLNSVFFGIMPRTDADLRVFCFPYAGGGASIFKDWQQKIPQNIQICPIQLPGRENRFADPLLNSVDDIVAEIIPVLRDWLTYPYILLGHSLGAKIAFELILKIKELGLEPPTSLIASACAAPHIPDKKPIGHLPDKDFFRALKEMAPETNISLDNKTLQELFLPLLRADFTASETYLYKGKREVLDCPIFTLGGTNDREVPLEELDAWESYTSFTYMRTLIEGEHLFIKENREAVIEAILPLLPAFV